MQTMIAEYAGMTPAESEIVDYLVEAGPTTAGVLAQKARLSRSTLSAMLLRLEKLSYITREEDPTDRRKSIISPNFHTLGQKVQPFFVSHGKAFDVITDAYSSDEVAFLISHYNKMTHLYQKQIDAIRQLVEADD